MADRKKARTVAFVAALALQAAACTTATPYQPYRPDLSGGVHGGYSEQRLQPDRFVVSFHGNELTSRDRVEGYLLYRAAELTVQNGSDWFSIIERHTEHDVQTYVPDPFYRPWHGPAYDYWRPDWRYYRQGYGWTDWYPIAGGPFWADRPDITRVESFEASAEIKLHKSPLVAATDQRAFDARRVLADLGPTIERPRR
jgi:hypothetical protein